MLECDSCFLLSWHVQTVLRAHFVSIDDAYQNHMERCDSAKITVPTPSTKYFLNCDEIGRLWNPISARIPNITTNSHLNLARAWSPILSQQRWHRRRVRAGQQTDCYDAK